MAFRLDVTQGQHACCEQGFMDLLGVLAFRRLRGCRSHTSPPNPARFRPIAESIQHDTSACGLYHWRIRRSATFRHLDSSFTHKMQFVAVHGVQMVPKCYRGSVI